MEKQVDIPKLRFPGFTENWKIIEGDKVFETITNKNHNSDLPILAITQDYGAIPRDLIDFKISVADKSIETYKVVEEGDFIISLRSFQGGIEYSNYKGICSPAYIILRPFSEIVDEFFKYYFKTERYIKLLNQKIEGIRDGKMISFKYFSDAKLKFPSLPEQTRIASFLSSVDSKLESLKKKKTLLEQYKKGIMQQIFSQQLRFKDENGNDFPDWEEKKLCEVSVFLDGRRKPIKESVRSKIKGKYPYYGASGIIDYVNDYIFDEDLILLGEDGENIISRNLPLAFRVSGKCWINNHAHVIKPKQNTDINFLTQNLERISFVQYNTGTAQPKLNQEVCKGIILPFPSLPEQILISSFLSSLDTKISHTQTQIDKTETWKKGLLQQMFV